MREKLLSVVMILVSVPAWADEAQPGRSSKVMFPLDRSPPASYQPAATPPNDFYVVRVCPSAPNQPALVLRNVTLATQTDFVAACAAAQK